MIGLSKELEGYMRTVKEINKQIEKEQDCVNQLYAQIISYEKSIERLKEEKEAAEKEETESFIDNWLNEHFGISNQQEARQKSIFIVFDKNANFVKIVTVGYGEKFHYVSPVEDEDTMEHWLRENKLYAHRASSFCDRNRNWYKLSFREQLENLCWEFDKNGKVKRTEW